MTRKAAREGCQEGKRHHARGPRPCSRARNHHRSLERPPRKTKGVAGKGIGMRGFLQRLRAGLDSRYEHELGCLRERHPWLADYDIQAPVRDWYAIHKPTGTTIGPAKNITALDRLIRADPQAARLRQRPVPYPLPDSETDDWEDRTLLDAWDTWPRSTDGTHPPRSAA